MRESFVNSLILEKLEIQVVHVTTGHVASQIKENR